MYAQYFGLRHEPFSIAPDPHYLFMSERHREALAHLLYGLGGGGGFVLLTGEIGTGKTTVCRCFLEQVPETCNIAYIFNPKLTVEELLRTVCDEFHVSGLPAPGAPATVKDFIDPLNEFLLKSHAAGRNSVLVIDEAQNLSAQVLEQLRLLTNLETSERKLLQIILIGQPELRDMLARPELEQLAQRVTARFHLEALSLAETGQYMAHRLAVAGLGTAMPFDAAAMRRIHRITAGVPRRINLLCDRAMLGAYASGQARIGPAVIDKAAAEVFDRQPRKPWLWWLLALALPVLLGGALLFMREPDSNMPSRLAASSAASAASRAASQPTASASTPAAATQLTRSELQAWLAGQGGRSADDAWRELASLWGTTLPEGAACPAAARLWLQCHRSQSSLALMRQLDRPGLLGLQVGSSQPVMVLLTGLSGNEAVLRMGGQQRTVSLALLAEFWRGDFMTFWRSPAGESSPREGPWMREQIARWRGESSSASQDAAALQSAVHAFQLAQGLPADGVAGPVTFMQLNRFAGVAEPHLQQGK